MVSRRRRILRTLLVAVVTLALVVGAAVWWFVLPSGVDEPALSGTVSEHEATIDGIEREWTTYVPAGLGTDVPVVFVLHGSFQDGAAMRRTAAYRFDELADEHGFAVVYPDGIDANWNECRAGGEWTAKTENVDDVGFLAETLDRLEADVAVDRSRVFATGFSSGGQMSLRLALEEPDFVSGVAIVAANVPTQENLACRDAGGDVPALFVEGTDDPMNPYEGGEVALYGFGSRGDVLSAQESVDWYSARTGSPRAELRTIEGGGHQYPAPGYRGPRFLGPSVEVDVPGDIVEFFGLAGG